MYLYHLKFYLYNTIEVGEGMELDKIGSSSSDLTKHLRNLKCLLGPFYVVKARYASQEDAKLIQKLLRKNFPTCCRYKYFRVSQFNEIEQFEFNHTFWLNHTNPRIDLVMQLDSIRSDDMKVLELIYNTTILCTNEQLKSIGGEDNLLQIITKEEYNKKLESAYKLQALIREDMMYDKKQFLDILTEWRNTVGGNISIRYQYLKETNKILSLIGYQVISSQHIHKRLYRLTRLKFKPKPKSESTSEPAQEEESVVTSS